MNQNGKKNSGCPWPPWLQVGLAGLANGFFGGEGDDPGAHAPGPLSAGAPLGLRHIGGGDLAPVHALGRDLLAPGGLDLSLALPYLVGGLAGDSWAESSSGGSISCGCAGFSARSFSTAGKALLGW